MTLENFYTNRLQILDSEIALFQQKTDKYSLYRLVVFLAACLVSFFAFYLFAWIAGSIVCLLSLLAFAYTIRKHSRINRQLNHLKNLKRVYQNEIQIKTENIFGNGEKYSNDQHPYSSDLDIFGKASIFSYINRTVTQEGSDFLASFLQQKANKQEISQRQEIISELSKKEIFKENFLSTRFLTKKTTEEESGQIHEFFSQFEPQLIKNKAFLFFSKILPFGFVGGIVAGFWFPFFWVLAGISFLAILYFFFQTNKWIETVDFYVGKNRTVFYKYSVLIRLICNEKFTHTKLTEIQSIIATEHKFDKELQKLSNLSEKLEYRKNGFVGVLLSLFCLWDIHCVIAIERWFMRNTQNFKSCLEQIGLMDAYLSLSIVRFNHHDWIFPEITENYFQLEAEEIGHPLINESQRISNRYTITGSSRIDIITGSNMAGKSTFLRTVGVNMVLAFAGLPVCAKSMNVSLADILTYMRIRDSLNENVSSFYAELLRLRQILDEVETNKNCFLLLDELLRGTNSKDKYEGSVAIIKTLIKRQTVAVVATHDLDLTLMENDFREFVKNYHFDIALEGEEFFFDYKLREGICKNFNASLLMKKMKIGDDF